MYFDPFLTKAKTFLHSFGSHSWYVCRVDAKLATCFYLNCVFKLIRDIQFVSVKEQDYPENLIFVRETLDIFVAKLTPSRVFDIISA